MPAETFVRDAGIWRKIPTSGIYVKAGGVWEPVDFAYVKDAGVWQTVYIRDNTGPGPATNARATWSTVSGVPTGTPSLYIQWDNPADPDFSYMRVVITPVPEPPLVGFNVSSGAPGASYGFHYTSYIVYNKPYWVTLTPYDINGNAGTSVSFYSNEWSGHARGRSISPLLIYPIDSGTYRPAIGGWVGGLATYRVQMGSADGYADNYGAYFYGEQVYDQLAGATIFGATFEYQRVNSKGVAGAVEPSLNYSPGLTSKATNPVAAGFFEGVPGTFVARDGSYPPYAYWNINPVWFDNLATGNSAATVRAIVFYRPGSVNTAEFYGYPERPGGVIPGRIVVSHNG